MCSTFTTVCVGTRFSNDYCLHFLVYNKNTMGCAKLQQTKPKQGEKFCFVFLFLLLKESAPKYTHMLQHKIYAGRQWERGKMRGENVHPKTTSEVQKLLITGHKANLGRCSFFSSSETLALVRRVIILHHKNRWCSGGVAGSFFLETTSHMRQFLVQVFCSSTGERSKNKHKYKKRKNQEPIHTVGSLLTPKS